MVWNQLNLENRGDIPSWRVWKSRWPVVDAGCNWKVLGEACLSFCLRSRQSCAVSSEVYMVE